MKWFLPFSMANLLAKLRIDYASLTMLQGVTDMPREETISLHSKLLDGFMEGENDDCFVTNAELKQLREKTYRQLRLREMLIQHSSDATLIVMSLPMPRQVRNLIINLNITASINRSSSLGNCFGSALHVVARYADHGYAAFAAGSWKSIISSYFLLLRPFNAGSIGQSCHCSISFPIKLINIFDPLSSLD